MTQNAASSVTQHFYTTPLNTIATIGGTNLGAALAAPRSHPVRQITNGRNERARQPQPACARQNPPSRPARPEAHQNQIHNTKEQTHSRDPAPHALGSTPRHSRSRIQPMKQTLADVKLQTADLSHMRPDLTSDV